MTTLTLEEQERRAYIEGRTAEAKYLAAIIDAPTPDWVEDLKDDLEDSQRANRRLMATIEQYEDGE